MCKKINIFFPCLAGFFFLGSMGIGIVMGLLAVFGIEMPYWFLLVASQLILLLPGIIYVIIMKINIFKFLPYRLMKLGDVFLSLLAGYLLIPLILFISNLSMLFSTNQLEDTMTDLTSYPFLLQILLLAVIPPIVEEFMCRGLFYHSYRQNGILGAAVMSGLVFGMIHMNINQFCYAFAMGVVFALMVEATGSMFSSMVAHFAVNTYSITMMKLLELVQGAVPEDMVQESVDLTQTNPDMANVVTIVMLVVLLILAVICTFLAFLIIRAMAKRNGRWDYLRDNLKRGLKAQNGEKFVTLPFVITAVVIGAYMILQELLIWITANMTMTI